MSARQSSQTTQSKKTSTALAQQINQILGSGTVSLGSDPRFVPDYIPTNVLPIDVLLQGGIPRGRITELFGGLSSLKSYIGLCAIAGTQRSGGTAVLVDTEHSFDPGWAAHVGVDPAALVLQQPTTGEEAVDAVQIAVAGHADLVVWDSIAATQPRAEAEVQLSSSKNVQPARLAALMSMAMRRLNSTNRSTALLCINQTRQKVGVVFGNPETTPGGRALPFFASYRVAFTQAGRITRTRKTYDGEGFVTAHETVVQKIRVQLTKSKLSRPDREEWFFWNLEKGEVELLPYLMAVGLEHGLITTNKEKGKTTTWSLQGKTYPNEAQFLGFLDQSPRTVQALTAFAWGRVEEGTRLLQTSTRTSSPRTRSGPRKRV